MRIRLVALIVSLAVALSAGAEEARRLSIPGGELQLLPQGQLDAREPSVASESIMRRPSALAFEPPSNVIPYRFYPLAGTYGKDLGMGNFVDLDSSSSVLDWNCGMQTYNGHTGIDSGVGAGWLEQGIGVPIFAALDGVVYSTHDGEPDQNTDWSNPTANSVTLDHGNGQYTLYWHMKKGSVAVTAGQSVRAGTQLGLMGSSGSSTEPHLHFESQSPRGTPFESFAGPCRAGASGWQSQPALPAPFAAVGYFSSQSFDYYPSFPYDDEPRTGAFVAGQVYLYLHLWVGGIPPYSTYRLRLKNPSGSYAYDYSGGLNNSGPWNGTMRWSFNWSMTALGTWHFLLDINGTQIADAPYDIVSSSTQIIQHAPRTVQLAFDPPLPAPNDVVFCRVTPANFVSRDPDYDVVRYHYVWTVNGATVRDVTSAGLADAIPAGTATTGDVVSCSVTPSDGTRTAATAQTQVSVTADPHAPATPTAFSATATTTTSIRIAWSGVSGADSYEIYRRAPGGSFALVRTVSTTATGALTWDDTAVSSATAYLYRLRAVSGSYPSAYTASDLATTVLFTDDPLTAGSTPIKAAAITQLRTAVNAVRTLAGLSSSTFTDASLSGVVVKSIHVTELRTALSQARSSLGLSAAAATNSAAAGTVIRALDVSELRDGVK